MSSPYLHQYTPQVPMQPVMASPMVAPSIADLIKSISPYQAGLFLLVALYSPSASSWHSNFPPLELMLQVSFFVGLIFVGCTTSKTNLSGPLRYGYHKHGHSARFVAFWQGLPGWAPYAAVAVFTLFPMSRVWLIGAVPIAWQYNLHTYRKEVRQITDRVDSYCSQAAMIANSARESALTAERYEQQALDTAAIAIRDARLANTIQTTDFFDKGMEAWAALHRSAESAKGAVEAARDAWGDAKRVYDMERSNNPKTAQIAEARFEKAKIAFNSADDALRKAQMAENTTMDSDKAVKVTGDSRTGEEKNSSTVVRAAATVTSWAGKAAPAAFNAATHAETVRECSLKAKAAAVDGDMEAAESSADEAEEALRKVTDFQRQVASARNSAREQCINLLLGK